MQCCIPHPCSSPETRRFREDSEKILRRFEDAESFAKAHFEYIVDLQGVSFATSWPCRAHQVLAPQCGTGWHMGGTFGRHMGGTWEARGSWCFNVFHGLSRNSACWNNCLQLFTWRYPSHFVNCSSCRNAVCFGTPTNSFKAVQHPVQ